MPSQDFDFFAFGWNGRIPHRKTDERDHPNAGIFAQRPAGFAHKKRRNTHPRIFVLFGFLAYPPHEARIALGVLDDVGARLVRCLERRANGCGGITAFAENLLDDLGHSEVLEDA